MTDYGAMNKNFRTYNKALVKYYSILYARTVHGIIKQFSVVAILTDYNKRS
jgi:hypothetical protein